jgi:pSer/pThr/pTyr-binding forkhead associated (FHA) protein
VFADAPPIAPPAPAPSVADAPTVAVTPPRASVFCLRGALGEFALPEGTHIVGRQDGVAVHIVDRQVSRNHAAITVTNGQLTIEDHASANGTSVNGARVTAARALKVGDQVKFGDLLFTVAVKS